MTLTGENIRETLLFPFVRNPQPVQTGTGELVCLPVRVVADLNQMLCVRGVEHANV